MSKRGFPFPMPIHERVLGLIYIPVHVFILPYALPYVLSLLRIHLTPEQQGLLYYGISALFCLLALNRYWKNEIGSILREPFRIIQAILLGFALFYIISWVLNFLSSKLDLFELGYIEEYTQALERNFRLTFVTSVVLLPIVIETLFRGALFGTLRCKSRLAAYIVSIIVFAMCFSWNYLFFFGVSAWWSYVIQTLPLSFALAWCYEWSGNICASTILNALLYLITSVSIHWR